MEYILPKKSLARIVLSRPGLNIYETFYLLQINMYGDLKINEFSCPLDKVLYG